MQEAVPSVVAIGASAGGVGALKELVSKLPEDLNAAVLIVLHIWPEADSFLPQILGKAGNLPAVHPAERTPLESGRIYIAPPDRHLMLQDSCVRVVYGPTENLHRPSIDVLFRSVAAAYGERAIGVLLTGSDDDGAGGLNLIQRAGGKTIVQDPSDSMFPEMPLSALRLFQPDYKLALADIAPTLERLATQFAERQRSMMSGPDPRPDLRELMPEASEEKFGTPSAFHLS